MEPTDWVLWRCKSFCTWPYPPWRCHDFFNPISLFGNGEMVLFIIFKCLVLTIPHYSEIADGEMEKCGELPAAEPEIEPRCPGLVWKLPSLSRRAMSRLQCRGVFRQKAKPWWAGWNTDGLWNPGTLSVCLSVGTALHWCREETECSCGSLLALSVSPFCDVWLCCFTAQSGQVSSRVPFPPRCVYRTGQLACGLAWLWEAAGSCVPLPSGLAKPRQCLAPQPQSLVRKKLKATQFWLISLCRPLTPPVTNPFIIALF